ncbi:hypothetical protein GGR57DRAFT_521004 [Xylariaceae sp. FL1272]|nr:hypothetical protein GGR57DRAFT_521004 [Xylariaceae sp. FL1272]
MASWTVEETLQRVAAQPGGTPKRWSRDELVRCGATGTNITTRPTLEGQVHPVLANWIRTDPQLHVELQQPLLLASKLIEAAGLTWLSDFDIDDIFDKNYPGRKREPCYSFIPESSCNESTVPGSIVRHHRAPWATEDQKNRWKNSTRSRLRTTLAKSVHWQLDQEIFSRNGWNGYTCRHPRGDLPLHELDKYQTIIKSDKLCAHEGSRNLSIHLMAEFPSRMAELRCQRKEQSEEYLLTAFMAAVTILHEIGHAVYWRDRRSLTRNLREPFYGADLEMELGDSFVAAVFGGWIPVPVRELSSLRKDFSFADGLAWRQALSWDFHRMRPKYRAHYSIPVSYISPLFTEKKWTESNDVMELIRPQLLVGNSAALRTTSLHNSLSQADQHATAAIADFHYEGDDWVWNRRPGACFRIPQYAGVLYPDIELPVAPDNVIIEPTARHPHSALAAKIAEEMEGMGSNARSEVSVRGGELPTTPEAEEGITKTRLNPRISEYSPRKFPLVSPTRIPRPASTGSPGSLASPAVTPRKRDSGLNRWTIQAKSPTLSQQSPVHIRAEKHELKAKITQSESENEADIPRVRLGGGVLSSERSEISVDELKKRLSQLIGVSLTEMEKLFECGEAV